MKYLALTFILLLLTGCKDEVISNGLPAWATGLEAVSLPLEGKCGNDIKLKAADSINGMVKGLPEGYHYARIAGYKDGCWIVLLLNAGADYQLPILATLNAKGNINDTLPLYKISCTQDEYYEAEASYTMEEDFQVTLRDHSDRYKRDGKGEIIKSSVKRQTHSYLYTINRDGMFARKYVD